MPEIKQYFVVTGYPVVSQMIGFARLVGVGKTGAQAAGDLGLAGAEVLRHPWSARLSGQPPSLGQRFTDKPVQFVVQTSQPYEQLQIMVDKLLESARQYPGMVNLDSDLKLNKPQLKIDLDRDKVASMGLEVDTVGRTLGPLGGRQVTRFKRNGKQYDVIVQVADLDRRNPDDVASIYVRNPEGVMVPMNNIIRLTEEVAPKELNHFNKLRSATLTATIAPGYVGRRAFLPGRCRAAGAAGRPRSTTPASRASSRRAPAALLHLRARSPSSTWCSRPSSRASSIR